MSVPINLFQIALAAALMLLSVVLSWRLRLSLGRDILIAGTRMTVQLLLVGLILAWVFALRRPWPIVGIGLVMTVLAAQAAVGRTKGRYPGIFLDAFAAIFGSSFVLTGLTLSGILQIKPWFEAQYAVPRRAAKLPLAAHRWSRSLHQPGDPCTTDSKPLSCQNGLGAGGTLGAPTVLIDRLDRRRQRDAA